MTERKRKREREEKGEEYLVVSYLVGERSRREEKSVDTQRPGYSEGVTELVIFH